MTRHDYLYVTFLLNEIREMPVTATFTHANKATETNCRWMRNSSNRSIPIVLSLHAITRIWPVQRKLIRSKLPRLYRYLIILISCRFMMQNFPDEASISRVRAPCFDSSIDRRVPHRFLLLITSTIMEKFIPILTDTVPTRSQHREHRLVSVWLNGTESTESTKR